jgi:hypothetical protein
LAADGRDGAEGTVVAAAFAYLQPCVGRTGAEQTARSGRFYLQGFAELFGPAVDVISMEPEVDFRDFGAEVAYAVAAGQTASHSEEGAAALGHFGKIIDQFKDGLHRFLNGRCDESAGVEENEVGLERVVDSEDGAERAEQTFGVHTGLGTAETLRIDAEHSTFRAGQDLFSGQACVTPFLP